MYACCPPRTRSDFSTPVRMQLLKIANDNAVEIATKRNKPSKVLFFLRFPVKTKGRDITKIMTKIAWMIARRFARKMYGIILFHFLSCF